jgi:vancomycin permeability regulator SanA
MLSKWFVLHWKLVSVLLGLSVLVTPIALHSYVNAATQKRLFSEVSDVFGAGIYPDGTPTPMLADRVSAAVELYKQGRVSKLLMTGDNSREDYDEVTAMQRYAVGQGVPIQDITLDHAGFSTYESCYRAKEIFGIKQAVLVTQNFHLPRAVYTCQRMGVESVGFGTPDWENYSKSTVTKYTMREKLSVLKALWEVHVSRPLPTFLGRFEGIN